MKLPPRLWSGLGSLSTPCRRRAHSFPYSLQMPASLVQSPREGTTCSIRQSILLLLPLSVEESLRHTAEDNLSYKKASSCRGSVSPVYRPGQQVWLSSSDIPLIVAFKTFSCQLIGPFHHQPSHRCQPLWRSAYVSLDHIISTSLSVIPRSSQKL